MNQQQTTAGETDDTDPVFQKSIRMYTQGEGTVGRSLS